MCMMHTCKGGKTGETIKERKKRDGGKAVLY